VADQVMNMPSGVSSSAEAGKGAPPVEHPASEEEEVQTKRLVQRVMEEEDQNTLQTKPLAASISRMVQRARQSSDDGFAVGGDLESRLSATQGGGSPLPEPVRNFMEPRFGADFSDVRIHTDSDTVQMNRALGAAAFTHGRDIYMGQSQYAPDSDAGKRL